MNDQATRLEGPGAASEVLRTQGWTGPLVSILTPSFNQCRFLGDCIDSVANQTYRPVEHIVCDGGSTDGTLDILEAAATHVRWVSEPDCGQAHALNKALELSRGSVIGWVNSDDAYADRRAIEWAVRTLERHPNVDVLFGHALLINERNMVLQAMWTAPLVEPLLRVVHYIYQPTLFIRRETLLNQPFFLREDLDVVVDRDLLFRLAAGSRFRRLSRFLAVDRHQRHRKVETRAYPEEAARFDQSVGIASTRRRAAAARGMKIGMRLMGALRTPTLPATVDPALPLRWPPTWKRLRFQLATPRRRMPF